MAKKLTVKQLQQLLANMPKPSQTVNAVENTGRQIPRPEENPASKEAYNMFLNQLQKKAADKNAYINDAGPARVYKNVGEKVRADLERESRQRDLEAFIPNEKFNSWAENVAMPVADAAMIAEGGLSIPKLLQAMSGKITPEAITAITKTPETIKAATTKIAPEAIEAISKTPKIKKPFVIEELPGLHLKSTMEGGPISKIIEPKTGLINTDQALAIIAKESNGAEKVNLVKQALGKNIPKKIDYNQFRKAIQNRLTPLEKNIATHASDYGIHRIGFIKKKDPWMASEKYLVEPLESKTILLSNKKGFGTGSAAHNNPNETLGHIHYLIDKETPDTITATQIQSDPFQGTHRSMPSSKRSNELQYELNKSDYEKQLNEFNNAEPWQHDEGIIYNKEGKPAFITASKNGEKYPLAREAAENRLNTFKNNLELKKAEIDNFEEKQLLDKNHPERYLQELIDYAAKKDGINKLRLPTRETAAKVQGYRKDDFIEELSKEYNDLVSKKEKLYRENKNTTKEYKDLEDEIIDFQIKHKGKEDYSSSSKTILKKYDEYPKMIKKLYGKDVKVVTDSKGNSWYEFEIPDKIKKGKGEIKAFSTAALGVLGKKLMDKKNKNGEADQ